MNINPIDLYKPQIFQQFSGPKHIGNVPFEHLTDSNDKAPSKVKIAAAIGSAIGTSVVFALIAKKQGFSFSKIKETPLKDWAIFKIAKNGRAGQGRKLIDIEEPEILGLAAGSITGGFVAGSLADKKNIKAKGREILSQFLGNVLVPVASVGGFSRLYQKFEQPLKSIMPTFITNNKKSLRYLNKFSKSIPAIAITAGALGLGIIAGNKVSNLINEKLFGQKTDRKIKKTDFAPHVDDLCLAVTLMGAKNSPVASAITRTIPFFLSVPGYQVGKAQELSSSS